jgi:hypothetical protein
MDTNLLSLPNEALARKVVSLYPENTDLAGSPLERGFILGREGVERDPQRYAAIFELLFQTPGLAEERYASFGIEVLNGLRRRDGLWQTEPVVQTANAVLDMVRNLPKTKRRNRLEGLANYNCGIMFHNLGKFEEAANFQMASATFELGAGNPDKTAIALFCAQVERTSASFVEGIKHDNLKTLWSMGQNLEEVMNQDWLDNVAIHLIEGYFLAGTMPPDLEWLLGLLDPQKTNFWPSVIHGVMVPCLEGNWKMVLSNTDALLNEVVAIPSSSTQKAIYAIVLAKARALRATGDMTQAVSLVHLMRTKFRRHHGGYEYLAVSAQEFDLSPD